MEKKNNQLTKTLHMPVLLFSLPVFFISFMLPIYSKSLGASAIEISGLYSIFTAVMLILRPFTGWAIDRFGRKPFFIAALFLSACSMFIFAYADSIFRLYLARLIGGIGSLFMGVSFLIIVADMSLSSERGKEMGKIFEQQTRGSILGVFFGIFLLKSFPPSHAWQFVFLGYTVMKIVALLLAWRNVPETKPALLEDFHQNWRDAVSKQLLKLMFIVFISGFSSFMLMPIVMIFLQDKFTNNIGQLALVFLPGALAVAFLSARFGQLSDRFGRIRLIVLGLALSGIFSIFIPYLSSLIWLAALWLFVNIASAVSGPAQTA